MMRPKIKEIAKKNVLNDHMFKLLNVTKSGHVSNTYVLATYFQLIMEHGFIGDTFDDVNTGNIASIHDYILDVMYHESPIAKITIVRCTKRLEELKQGRLTVLQAMNTTAIVVSLLRELEFLLGDEDEIYTNS